MKKRIFLIAGGIFLVFALICGFGGYSLYRSLNETANALGPEAERAEKNGIPLAESDLHTGRTLNPENNAALIYKELFDEWVVLRPQIDDARWASFAAGQARGEDYGKVRETLSPLAGLFEQASSKEEAQWLIDYSQGAFASYPVFPAVLDASVVWVSQLGSTDNAYPGISPEELERGLRVSNHIIDSRDPGSLQTAAGIRMGILREVSDRLRKDALLDNRRKEWPDLLAVLDNTPDIDPLPVWRTTAYLQLQTWQNYDQLSESQQELFATARRDDGVIIDAATVEILKFWNEALEEAEGKPALTQYITLGEKVRLLRERTDPAATPLIKLWSLDSATKGAGSIDWLIANEQLQLMRQVLDILIESKGTLPDKFDCKRQSVIGQKPFAYERTPTGFKLSATPSNILAPDSPLAQQSLAYEFVER